MSQNSVLRLEESSLESAASGQDACLAQYLHQYGDFTLAYNTFAQDLLKHFVTEHGYIAYAQKWGFTFVLGDPVAEKSTWPSLVNEFLGQFRKPCFVQCSAELAEILVGHRYWVNEFGYDTVLNLGTYDFRGKTKEKIRYAENWLKRRNFRMFERSGAEVPTEDIAQLSASWRKTKTIKRREVGFLNRPLSLEDEPLVRKFFLYDADGRLVAFAFFDPMFRQGKPIGYTTVIKRRDPQAPIYAETGLIKYAIDCFRCEKLEKVTLGLAPLAGMENNRFKPNPFLKFGFQVGYNAWWVNRFFYNLKGHAQYKDHFRGEKVKTYYCSRDLFNDLRLATLCRLMGVL